MDGDMISMAKYSWFLTKFEKESIWQAPDLQKYEFSDQFKPDFRVIRSMLDFLTISEKRKTVYMDGDIISMAKYTSFWTKFEKEYI